MSTHTCGTVLPTTVGPHVEHLAACPETNRELRDWLRAIVSAVHYEAALVERPRKVVDRACERCGTTFTTTNVRKRFCTTACRSRGYRERSAGAA